MNLIIDIGNTRVKAAVFKQDTLIDLHVFEKRKIISEIKKIVAKNHFQRGIISSVAVLSEKKLQKLTSMLSFIVLTSTTKVPFKNFYGTPKTLGVDRIALVTAAVKKYPAKNILIIDAGTCITFDFVNTKKEYLGGAISPGIAMRYKSLQIFTGKLPLLEAETPNYFIGKSTKESIHSGLLMGFLMKLKGLLCNTKTNIKILTIVLTGGDTKFLAKQLKSSIFANLNFSPLRIK